MQEGKTKSIIKEPIFSKKDPLHPQLLKPDSWASKQKADQKDNTQICPCPSDVKKLNRKDSNRKNSDQKRSNQKKSKNQPLPHEKTCRYLNRIGN